MMEIKIISYNSTGLSPLTVEFIKDMLDAEQPEIVLLQETFTLQSTEHKVSSIHPDYLVHTLSGVDENLEYLHGRPSGGLAIMWRKSLAHRITKVKPLVGHRRLCAVKLTVADSDVLIMNAYMPNDNYSVNTVRPEFSEVCDQIELMINGMDSNYVVLGGDLNVDFRRNNAHSNWISDIMARNAMINAWDSPQGVPDDTYIAHQNVSKSQIDHFLCTGNLLQTIQNVNVLTFSNNMSNHRPIALKLNVDEVISMPLALTQCSDGRNRISWHRVKAHHVEQYKKHVDRMLQEATIPTAVYCQDIHCDSPHHRVQIDKWCQLLTDICIDAGEKCLPKCKSKSSTQPGWSEHVKNYKSDSMRWHHIWLQCGCPESGPVFDCMKAAKRQYAYAARRVIRQERQMTFERMAQKAAANKSRDFWCEVKKMKSRNMCAPNVNGITDDQDIADTFKTKYAELYTSVPSSVSAMDQISAYINNELKETCVVDHLITETEVAKAIDHLKSGKADGSKGLISDHLKYAPKRMHLLIAILLNTVTRHGHMPSELLLSTICSIPKDARGNICDMENYRGIALSSCLSKIHDIIILNKYSAQLCTSEMQFAFKGHHSTSMCTLVLKEVASYFQRNKGDTFTAIIDASKAFDRIQHDKLFEVLVKRKLPAIIIRILLDSYKRQQLRAKWNNSFSNSFTTLNGIKQGSITSPVLFTVYMDVLLTRLEQSGYGCKIGGYYYGALSYADDLTLMCPSLYGLQQMLKICETFGTTFGVKYNPSKSMVMYIGRQNYQLPDLYLAGQPLKWVSMIKHLGNYVRSDLSENTEISHKRGDLIGRVNGMCATFYKSSDSVKQEIFNSQCSHLYGCESWNFAQPAVDRFRKTWNHGVRKIFGLPYQTHTKYLQYFIGRPYVTCQIYQRFYKLLQTMVQSKNSLVAYIAKLMLYDSSSIICRNLQIICGRYDFNYYERLCRPYDVHKFKTFCLEDERTVAQINELRTVADDFIFSNDDVYFIINYLCCS